MLNLINNSYIATSIQDYLKSEVDFPVFTERLPKKADSIIISVYCSDNNPFKFDEQVKNVTHSVIVTTRFKLEELSNKGFYESHAQDFVMSLQYFLLSNPVPMSGQSMKFTSGNVFFGSTTESKGWYDGEFILTVTTPFKPITEETEE